MFNICKRLQVWNTWTLCSCSCLDCPPRLKQSYEGFTFISCLEFLLGAVAGKHRTSTVKGTLRGTFCRGRIPSKGAGGVERWHKTEKWLAALKISGSWNHTKSLIQNEWNFLWQIGYAVPVGTWMACVPYCLMLLMTKHKYWIMIPSTPSALFFPLFISSLFFLPVIL